MGTQTYTASGLTPLTAYTLGTRTEGPAGTINATWVNNTSTTALAPPAPPASITNLHNTTYLPTTITWNWTDPSSPGYTNARVFLNDVFQQDVAKGVQTFSKTGLNTSTAFNRIHPQNKYRGTYWVYQRDLGYQHVDDRTGFTSPGSPGKRHEPPQYYLPADFNHLGLD